MSEIRVNNITNRDGSTGTTVAGIPVVDSTSHFVVPTGRTGQRYADGGENIVRDGLVLHLDAKYSYPSKTGITTTTDSLDPDVYTWYDMSGYENNGEVTSRNKTASAGPSYKPINGGSLVFNGSDDYIDFTNDPSLNFGTDSFSISIWFTRNPNDTANQRLIFKGAQSNVVDQAGFSIFGSNTQLTFAVNPSGERSLSTIGISSSTWTNIAAICEKKEDGIRDMVMYRNGGEEKTAITRITLPGSVSNMNVQRSLQLAAGKSSTVANLFWSGEIAQVGLYNRALTAAEVSQNYNALKDRFGL